MVEERPAGSATARRGPDTAGGQRTYPVWRHPSHTGIQRIDAPNDKEKHVRRIGTIVAAFAVPMLLLSACRTAAQPVGARDAPTTSPATRTIVASPGRPSPTATAASPRTGNHLIGYPADYAGAVLAAWSSHDTARLALLTVDPNNFWAIVPRHPDPHWTRIGCKGPMSSLCQYANRDGDAITIAVNTEAVSRQEWHVANLYRWNPINFPADARAYADAFMHAWIDGNRTRMLLLSTQRVVDHFAALHPIDLGYTITMEGAMGHSYARITRAGGFSQTLSIVNIQVDLGLPHAIDSLA
jgi:hypothetical protein